MFTLVTSKSCKLDYFLIKTHLIQQSVNVGSPPTQHFIFNLSKLPFENPSIHLMEKFVFKKMKCSSSVKCTVAENLWKCMRISWNFQRGGGGGGGGLKKSLPWGRYGYFLKLHTHCYGPQIMEASAVVHRCGCTNCLNIHILAGR